MSGSGGPTLFDTPEQIEMLVSRFETCTLPASEWTHYAHLTVGLWYLSRYEKSEATGLIRRGIQKYNHSRGVLQTVDGGYHETITLFYVWLIIRYLKNATRKDSIVEMTNELLRTCGDRRLPLDYYSRERLMSWEARTGWVEPDLKQLD
ncbi:MAG TPA: hypothetical protein VFV34_11230 [Blastocatellia bacterium]|nr:hypothetical protein [Blastocatellia bacterium]